jgi:uncharacterized membrane protein YbhN (UPF0104 family)
LLRIALRLGLALLLSAVCLGWLFGTIDRALLAEQLATVDWRWLAAAVALTFLFPFWRAARLRGLLPAGTDLPLGTCWRIAAETLLWSMLLPMKLGELSYPVLFVRRLNLGVAAATGLFVLIRLADFAALVGVFALGVGLGTIVGAPWSVLAVAIAVPLLAAPYGLVALTGFASSRVLAGRPTLAAAIAAAAHARTPGARLRFVVTSWGLWLTHAATVACAVAATGTWVGFGNTLLTSASGNLAFALPLTGVLGLGPQQVAVATTVEMAGIPWEIAVLGALTTYVSVLTGAVTTGAFAWAWGALSPCPTKKPLFEKDLPD